MNERVHRELERTLGGASVSVARPRFDAAQVPMVAPRTAEGICTALELAQREKWVVVPVGLGSKLSWIGPPARVDFLLSTRAFTGVVAYEPGDGTLTARAGTTMAELSAKVAAGGHALTPDVPRPESATLGGAIGAAHSGSDRLRYGPVRDHVLGVQFALGDGTIAKSGGRLVKNVTGYDLQRLFTGSHGSLCVILEASMRLFGLPQEECLATVVAKDSAELTALCATLLAAALRPISLSAERIDPQPSGSEWLLSVRLGGRPEVVAEERAALEKIRHDFQFVHATKARAQAEILRDRSFAEVDGPLLRVEVRPSAFSRVLERIELALAARDKDCTFHPRWTCEPGLASIDAALRPSSRNPAFLSRTLATLRAELEPLGARVKLLHAPNDVIIEPPALPAPARALTRRIREQLDPGGVLQSGRFQPLP